MNQKAFRIKFQFATTTLKVWLFAHAVNFAIKALVAISTNAPINLDLTTQSKIILNIPLVISVFFFILCAGSIMRFFAFGAYHVPQPHKIHTMSKEEFLAMIHGEDSKKDQVSKDETPKSDADADN